MRLVTWNVNSLKARLPRVLEFLAQHEPDVLCLQETKCAPEAFPVDELRAAGYEAAHHSGGRWAGVAVLARAELGVADARAGLDGEVQADQARWIEATVAGVRVASVYVVNGQEVGSPVFDEKLRFLEAMAARAAALRDTGAEVVIAGDMNVCPTDADVYDPAAFAGATHVTEAERRALAEVARAGGLSDAYRAVHPEPEQQFTWWDYRAGHFHKGLGLRIDLILASAGIAGALTSVHIERDYRKGTKPSDHVPLVADW
ncbi:exodeoxyribonuclease III [Paraconexibacter antarcticus]|uniref:Exodeoxyribonuclease III n=1 Tax=Paraconexibacter antarcticus TaxID=2949664 RepID=A0ABY5DUI8_9ACTN|nr:exodeoxyribonuclease III [Paraconexibacter antarcticus]UTI65673.1 exodeoxyribonuclease III [Paraconexibacter antarcticus]